MADRAHARSREPVGQLHTTIDDIANAKCLRAVVIRAAVSVLGSGATIGGLGATSWQDQGGFLLRDDDAGATCTGFTLS